MEQQPDPINPLEPTQPLSQSTEAVQPPTESAGTPLTQAQPEQPASPGQISPSFNPRAQSQQDQEPLLVKKGNFIKGYNFKFLIIIILVFTGVFSAIYFKDSPVMEYIKAAASSMSSGVLKKTTSEVQNSGSSNTTNKVIQTTTTVPGQTIIQSKTTYQTTQSATTSTWSDGQPITTEPDPYTTNTPVPTGTADDGTTVACIPIGQELNPASQSCCDGSSPTLRKITSVGQLQVVSYKYYCE
jgi:hypothetical protein